MRRVHASALVVATLVLVPGVAVAQGDTARAVAGGGIAVPGWQGKIDAREAASGQTLNNARLVKEGEALHVVTAQR